MIVREDVSLFVDNHARAQATLGSRSLIGKIKEAIKKVLEWLLVLIVLRTHLAVAARDGPSLPRPSALNHLGRRNIHNRRLHFAHNRSKGARQLHRVRNRQRRGVGGGRGMRCSHASGSHSTDHNADGQCDCNQKGRENFAISRPSSEFN